MDDGRFKLRVFGKEQRELKDQFDQLDINKVLNLDNHTIPVAGFPDPYITSCFIDDDRIFVNFFHNVKLTHYMFIYSIKSNKIVSEVEHREMECTKKNFPYKTFYNSEDNEIYTFYRQGQGYSI
jgi:hypothetical protein